MKRGRPGKSALDRALEAWFELTESEKLAFAYVQGRAAKIVTELNRQQAGEIPVITGGFAFPKGIVDEAIRKINAIPDAFPRHHEDTSDDLVPILAESIEIERRKKGLA